MNQGKFEGKVKFSLRYKLQIIFTSFLAISLVSYYFYASNIFEKDRIAQVYTVGLNQTAILHSSFKNLIKKLYLIEDTLIVNGKNQSLGILEKFYKSIHVESKTGHILKSNMANKKPNFLLSNIPKLSINSVNNFITVEHIRELKNELVYFYIEIEAQEILSILRSNEIGLNAIVSEKGEFLHEMPNGANQVELANNILTITNNTNSNIGTSELKTSLGVFLLSYNKIIINDVKISLVNISSKEVALQATKYLKEESFYFLLVLTIFSSLITLFSSRIITKGLNQLYESAISLARGNYSQIEVVQSYDEIQQLALTFNFLSSEVERLVEELREHNLQLEHLVELRTRDLKIALDLQKDMVNSVSQGFMMFDKENKLLPTYSNSIKNLIGNDVENKNLSEIIGEKREDRSKIDEYYRFIYEELLPFNDAVALFPKYIKLDDKVLLFEYHPSRDENNKLKAMVVIVTDKTKEIHATEKAELEIAKSKAILFLANNKDSFNRALARFNEFFKINFYNKNNKLELHNLQFFLHTFKGLASLYKMKVLKEDIHNFETYLKENSTNINSSNLLSVNEVVSRLESLIKCLNDYIYENQSIIGYADLRSSIASKTIDTELIKDFEQMIFKYKVSPEVIGQYQNYFLSTHLNKLLSPYVDLLKSSTKGDKLISPMKINDINFLVPDSHFDLFDQFVHIFRNTIDHGLESKNEREKAGKDPAMSIHFEALKENDQYIYKIVDDGKGLDSDLISKKAIERGILKISDDINETDILNLIFENNFSSKDSVDQNSGRGVGLAALKEAVLKLNGTIEVQSRPGYGCTFIISVDSPSSLKLVA